MNVDTQDPLGLTAEQYALTRAAPRSGPAAWSP
jgi:hypothetical protein